MAIENEENRNFRTQHDIDFATGSLPWTRSGGKLPEKPTQDAACGEVVTPIETQVHATQPEKAS